MIELERQLRKQLEKDGINKEWLEKHLVVIDSRATSKKKKKKK